MPPPRAMLVDEPSDPGRGRPGRPAAVRRRWTKVGREVTPEAIEELNLEGERKGGGEPGGLP